MKTIVNVGDFTIQIRLYGRLIEIPVKDSISPENFMMFDEKGREEILNFLAIKLKKEGYKIKLINFEKEIECPCCKAKVNLEEEEKKEEAPIKPKRGRKKKEI